MHGVKHFSKGACPLFYLPSRQPLDGSLGSFRSGSDDSLLKCIAPLSVGMSLVFIHHRKTKRTNSRRPESRPYANRACQFGAERKSHLGPTCVALVDEARQSAVMPSEIEGTGLLFVHPCGDQLLTVSQACGFWMACPAVASASM
jgi:hypothetical protein